MFSKQKTSSVKSNVTQNSIVPFNEHFYFVCENFSLGSGKVEVHLRNHELLFKDSLIGQCEFDLGLIYSNPDHCIINKWMVLTNPKNLDFSKPAGFIKVSVSFQCCGDADIDLTQVNENASEIILPPHVNLEPVQLAVKIIKVHGLHTHYPDSSIFCEVNYNGNSRLTSDIKLDKEQKQGYWFEEILLSGSVPGLTDYIKINVLAKGLLFNSCIASLEFDFESCLKGNFSEFFWENLFGQHGSTTDTSSDIKHGSESASTWAGRLLLSLSLSKNESPLNLTQKIRDYSISDYIYKQFEETEQIDVYFQVLQAVGVPSEYSVYSCRLSLCEFSVCTKQAPVKNNQCDWSENLPRKRFDLPKNSKVSVFVYLESETQEKILFCQLNHEEFKNTVQEPRWVSLVQINYKQKPQTEYKCAFIQLNLFICYASNELKNKPPWSSSVPKALKPCTLWFNLYQARNIPVSDLNGKSDPYIEIYCAGVTTRSSVRANTLNPMWFEVLKLKIELRENENLPVLIYLKDEDLLSSELITVFPMFLNSSSLNSSNPANPSWYKLENGEILCSINLYTGAVPNEYSLKPEFVDAVLEINCLGLRNLDSAVGWMPVNKAYIQFDLNSLDTSPNQALKSLRTQPNESGRNPTINSVIKAKFQMPIDPIFAPSLSCSVHDYLFHGLTQPQIGSFSINIKELISKSKKTEPIDNQTKIKLEDVQIDLNTEDFETTQMVSVVRTGFISAEEAQKGGFRWDSKYEKDLKGRVKEISKPDEHFLQIGYNRKPGDNMKHYRYMLEGGLEDSGYIEKYLFDQFEIKKISNPTKSFIFQRKYEEKVVGLFKGLARICKIGDKVEENEEFLRIQQMMLKKSQVIIRVYIVSCLNLQSKDIKSESDPYIIIKLGEKGIKDDKNFKANDPNPKFFTHFDLPATLPGPSKLKVQVWDKDDYFKDDRIGQTVIDIEDRIFSLKFQTLSEKPIEKRQLFNKCSKVPQGSILLWLEIHPSTSIPPPIDISEKPPIQFDLRLIIWQTADIQSSDIEDTSDLYIKATLNSTKIKETDTHYRCQNGSGQFNWRILFNLLLPSSSCIINLQAWDRDVFTFNDYIGDCSFSFAQLAKDAFESSVRLKMRGGKDSGLKNLTKQDPEKFWLDLKKAEKIVGKVQISFELIPLNLAQACPVGEGRSEPNVDPFLPDPTGRFELTLNPFKLISQTCGPRFRCKIFCVFCCVLCVYLLIMIGPSILGGLIGTVFN